jgi:hypothetical protein
MVGTKLNGHRVTTLCSTKRSASSLAVINMNDVMRARITSARRAPIADRGSGPSRHAPLASAALAITFAAFHGVASMARPTTIEHLAKAKKATVTVASSREAPPPAR